MIDVKRVMHPTDFSDYSNEACKYACALSDKFGSELHLVHVLPEPATLLPHDPMGGVGYLPEGWVEDMLVQSEQQLAKLPNPDWYKGTRIVRASLEGPAFLEIIRYAKDNDIDMIVMSTHGRTGIPHLLMGSVAENVVRKAPCPVLTLRPRKHQFVMP